MQSERRLWREDNMAWAMAPADIEPGQTFTWAGKTYRVAQLADRTLRIREISAQRNASR